MALFHVNFDSKVLDLAMSADVIIPQRLGQAGISDYRYPTLYLLHGYSDDHTAWQRQTSIERYAIRLGLAVVMPNAHTSGYANMAHGNNYYTFISEEIPAVMRGMFPLSDKREDNFIAGLSMGGAGAMKIGLAHPEQYAAIGCLSAGLGNFHNQENPTPQQIKQRFMLYGDRDLTGTEEDAVHSAKVILQEGKPVPRIYHACGTEDTLALPGARKTRDFFQSFPGNPFGYVYEVNPGIHNWDFWDEHIQHFLRFTGLPQVPNMR